MTFRAMMAAQQQADAVQTSEPRDADVHASSMAMRPRNESGRSPSGFRPPARSPVGSRPAGIRRAPSLRRDESSGIFGADIVQQLKALDEVQNALDEDHRQGT